jgi:hypothetical protein
MKGNAPNGKSNRLVNRPCPRLLHHSSGQAYVAWKVNGTRRWRYLGLWGSPAAGVAYQQFAASWPEPLLEQPSTRPRPPRRLTHDDITQTLSAWARERGLKPGTLAYRLDVLKWSVERALFTPARAKGACPRMQRDGDGRASVRWRYRGKRLGWCLGNWGTDETEAEYQKFAREWNRNKEAVSQRVLKRLSGVWTGRF